MKYSLFLTPLILLLMLNFTPVIEMDQENSSEELEQETNTNKMNEKLLRHVVLIKFKENATEKDIRKVEEAFSALPDKISAIKDYEWGTNNSPEGLNKGFTHCFFVTFESEEGRKEYLPHPDHQAFVEVLKPHMEDVLVIDYWTNED